MTRKMMLHTLTFCFVLAVPVLAVVPLLISYFGDNGKFDWFLVGTKTGDDVEHTIAYGVNEDNVIVGTYEGTGGDEHGFVTKDEGEHIRGINYPGACATDVGAINDEGVIAGTFEKWTGPGACGGGFVGDLPFVYEDGEFEALDFPDAAKFKTTAAICSADGGTYNAEEHTCRVRVIHIDVHGINDDSRIVGSFSPADNASSDLAFVFTDEKLHVLEVCNDAAISSLSEGCSPDTTDGWGINDDEVVVGHYEDNNGDVCIFDPEDGTVCEPHHHGFIWTEDEGYKKLYCDGDVLSNTDANGINDDGVIVGRCDNSAFVVLPPYGDTDWTTFTVPDPTGGQFRCPTGWEFGKTIAWGISNEGKIVGEYSCENQASGVPEKSYSFEVSLKTIVKE